MTLQYHHFIPTTVNMIIHDDGRDSGYRLMSMNVTKVMRTTAQEKNKHAMKV